MKVRQDGWSSDWRRILPCSGGTSCQPNSCTPLHQAQLDCACANYPTSQSSSVNKKQQLALTLKINIKRGKTLLIFPNCCRIPYVISKQTQKNKTSVCAALKTSPRFRKRAPA